MPANVVVYLYLAVIIGLAAAWAFAVWTDRWPSGPSKEAGRLVDQMRSNRRLPKVVDAVHGAGGVADVDRLAMQGVETCPDVWMVADAQDRPQVKVSESPQDGRPRP